MRSPNFNDRPQGEISLIVIHYTGMKTAQAAIERLCDPAAEVSAHYVIEEDGALHHLVADENRAWHAGVSSWGGRGNVNDFSIGIELVNPGHEFGYRPFPDAQMTALLELLKTLVTKHNIPPGNIVGHSDVAPGRKIDPGELFDWDFLARHGLGQKIKTVS